MAERQGVYHSERSKYGHEMVITSVIDILLAVIAKAVTAL